MLLLREEPLVQEDGRIWKYTNYAFGITLLNGVSYLIAGTARIAYIDQTESA